MTKFVNLDELAAPKRVVKFKGVEHEVKEFSVEDFIDFQSGLNDLEKAEKDKDYGAVMSIQSRIIKRALPTVEGDPAKIFTPVQLMTIVNLISQVFPDNDTPAAATEKDTSSDPPQAA